MQTKGGTAMNNKTIPDVLGKVMTRPTDESGATVDSVILTPDIAEHILANMNWEKDRTIGRYNAEHFANFMRKDEVLPGREILFAPDAWGNQQLVDGHVLLEAAILAGWTGKWTVVCQWEERFSAEKVYVILRAWERIKALDMVTTDDVARRLKGLS